MEISAKSADVLIRALLACTRSLALTISRPRGFSRHETLLLISGLARSPSGLSPIKRARLSIGDEHEALISADIDIRRASGARARELSRGFVNHEIQGYRRGHGRRRCIHSPAAEFKRLTGAVSRE